MKNQAGYVLFGMALLVIVWLGFSRYKTTKRNRELAQAVAQIDSLRQETETIYLKKVVESGNIKSKNDTLNRIVSEQDAQIRFLVDVIGQYDVAQISGNAVESTDSQRVRVDFNGKDKGVAVSGWTETPPPIFSLEVTRDPVDLSVVLAQDKYNIWSAIINTNDPYLRLNDVNVQANPYKPPWYKNIKLVLIGGVVNQHGPMASIGVGYSNWMVNWVYLDRFQGITIGRILGL